MTPARSRRRGASLIETLVAMFLISVVLAMAIALLNALFRLEGGVKAHADARAATARLARAFRRDARRAVAVIEPPPDGAVVGLRLGAGHDIAYRVDRGSPERIETRPDGRRFVERFRTPARGLSVVAEGSSLRLRFARRAAGARPIEIGATLGADRRFAALEESP
jgi:type II secretory pathway pseudopilin PulG